MTSFTEMDSHPQFSDSPTPTPLHTRTSSLVRGRHAGYSVGYADLTVGVLQRVLSYHQEDSEVTMHDMAEKEAVGVSVTDGSRAVPFSVKARYLALYFALNIGLTLYNKALMSQLPYPFLLTALHAAAGCIGSLILLKFGFFTLTFLPIREILKLVLFSIVYTVNIALSNYSLMLVTIPFHQVVRATTPVFTVIVYRACFSSPYSLETYLSLIPVIIGVAFATYGDYYYTVFGFLVTLLGAVLAAFKTVATNHIQTAGLRLSAFELLYRLSPCALVGSLGLAYLNGEVTAFNTMLGTQSYFDKKCACIVLLNGALAFALNVVSFSANKKTGALTMTVAANIKQIVTVGLAIMFWHLKVGWMNAIGIALTLAGGAWFARAELMAKGPSKASYTATNIEEGKR